MRFLGICRSLRDGVVRRIVVGNVCSVCDCRRAFAARILKESRGLIHMYTLVGEGSVVLTPGNFCRRCAPSCPCKTRGTGISGLGLIFRNHPRGSILVHQTHSHVQPFVFHPPQRPMAYVCTLLLEAVPHTLLSPFSRFT
jgi:hypothetical protein